MTDIKAILDLWFQLRETPKEHIPIHNLSSNLLWSYSVKRDLEQAFEMDPEGLTALLLLDNLRADFFPAAVYPSMTFWKMRISRLLSTTASA